MFLDLTRIHTCILQLIFTTDFPREGGGFHHYSP